MQHLQTFVFTMKQRDTVAGISKYCPKITTVFDLLYQSTKILFRCMKLFKPNTIFYNFQAKNGLLKHISLVETDKMFHIFWIF